MHLEAGGAVWAAGTPPVPTQRTGSHGSIVGATAPAPTSATLAVALPPPSDPATTVASTPIPTSTITPAMLADPTSNVALGASTAASVWAQGRWSALTQRPSS